MSIVFIFLLSLFPLNCMAVLINGVIQDENGNKLHTTVQVFKKGMPLFEQPESISWQLVDESLSDELTGGYILDIGGATETLIVMVEYDPLGYTVFKELPVDGLQSSYTVDFTVPSDNSPKVLSAEIRVVTQLVEQDGSVAYTDIDYDGRPFSIIVISDDFSNYGYLIHFTSTFYPRTGNKLYSLPDGSYSIVSSLAPVSSDGIWPVVRQKMTLPILDESKRFDIVF